MKFNALYPELIVLNLERSLQFYVEVLGFRCEYDRPEEKFAFLSLDEAQIMLHSG
jgi:lactoylglutathione lyase